MFDPGTGRWFQLDPTGFDAGDTNLYRFVGNAPTNFIDPSGLGRIRWGHHWVSISLLDELRERKQITDEAYTVGRGAATGPLDPKHDNHPRYGGHTDGEYIAAVKRQLDAFLKSRSAEPGKVVIDEDTLIDFIEKIRTTGEVPGGDPNDAKLIREVNDHVAHDRAEWLRRNRLKPSEGGLKAEHATEKWDASAEMSREERLRGYRERGKLYQKYAGTKAESESGPSSPWATKTATEKASRRVGDLKARAKQALSEIADITRRAQKPDVTEDELRAMLKRAEQQVDLAARCAKEARAIAESELDVAAKSIAKHLSEADTAVLEARAGLANVKALVETKQAAAAAAKAPEKATPTPPALTAGGKVARETPGRKVAAKKPPSRAGKVTNAALGLLGVYPSLRDALQEAGVIKPDYETVEAPYYFVATDQSVFVVEDAWLWRDPRRVFVAGPRKGQTETITAADVGAYRKEAEAVWGKYIPGSFFSDPRFIPGTERKTLPLYRGLDPIGWIDEEGVHYYPSGSFYTRPRS